MGYASLLEDTIERFADSTPRVAVSGGYGRRISVPEAVEALRKAYESLPQSQRRLRDLARSFLGRIDQLADLLDSGATQPREPDPGAIWQHLEASRHRVLEHFAQPHALSLSLAEDFAGVQAQLSQRRAEASFLRAYVRPVLAASEPAERQRLDHLVHQIEADIDRYVQKCKVLEARLTKAWADFRERHKRMLTLARRRPSLQHIDPWLLDDAQLALVEHTFSGEMALHGTSGSGKTVVLLHRALRRARRSANATVLVLARHDTLVRHLRTAAAVLSGGIPPPNLRILSLYDLWAKVVHELMGEADLHRLRDGTATTVTERTSPTEAIEHLNSWFQWVRHTPRSLFKEDREVRWLRQDLSNRLPLAKRRDGYTDPYLAAERYLYEEVAYIRSAFPRSALPDAYLNMSREGRTIPFQERHRRVCLQILEGWSEWLRLGHVNDVVGLTWRAADFILDDGHLERCRLAVGADHILVDELQDLSTLDLRMIRRLGAPSDDAEDAFFFVGDLEQKGSSLHLNHRMSGFNFQGRVRHVRRNYRNTREILRAAHAVVSDSSIRRDLHGDPDLEIRDPELSVHTGNPPVVVPCQDDLEQTKLIVGLVRDRRAVLPSPSIAIVSESAEALDSVERHLTGCNIPVERIWGIDDLDQRAERSATAERADRVYLGGFDAVRGLEFDTLVVANLSDAYVPRPDVEAWRNAARLYSTLTRARDELVITVIGEPSRFLASMETHVEWIRAPGEGDEVLRHVLSLLGSAVRTA